MSRTDKTMCGEYFFQSRVVAVLGKVGGHWRRDTSDILCVRSCATKLSICIFKNLIKL